MIGTQGYRRVKIPRRRTGDPHDYPLGSWAASEGMAKDDPTAEPVTPRPEWKKPNRKSRRIK